MEFEFDRIYNKRLDESYYKGVLDNGLTVYVYPMPHKNGIHAMLSAKIGSVTRDFILGGRRVTVPSGVAHFLEHKLFEGEEGEDAFTLFAETGASANAYTSFDRTCYLFSATIHIEQSLRTLIRFVTHPYFTKETVDKEQGIIAQEIKMYDDNADWVLTTMMLANLYAVHPIRDDIAGTVESIAQITPQTLYDCYNGFYRPDNMVLAIAGNIEPDTVARICQEEYADAAAPDETVGIVSIDEPPAVAEKYSERTMDVFEQQFALGYKEKPFFKKDEVRGGIVLRLLLELLVGETSPLYRKLYDSGLINGMFDASALSGEDYLCIAFSGESAQPNAVVAAVKAEIARQRKQGIDAQRFEEHKRALIGDDLCSFDSIEGVATKMTVGHFKSVELYSIIDLVESIKVSDVQQMLDAMLDNEKSTLAVIKPLRGQE